MVGNTPLLDLVCTHFFVYCDVWDFAVFVYDSLGLCVIVHFVLLSVVVQMLQSQPFEVIQVLKLVADACDYITDGVDLFQFGRQFLGNIVLSVHHLFVGVFDNILERLLVIELLLLALDFAQGHA